MAFREIQDSISKHGIRGSLHAGGGGRIGATAAQLMEIFRPSKPIAGPSKSNRPPQTTSDLLPHVRKQLLLWQQKLWLVNRKIIDANVKRNYHGPESEGPPGAFPLPLAEVMEPLAEYLASDLLNKEATPEGISTYFEKAEELG